jgi:hypothetical protein
VPEFIPASEKESSINMSKEQLNHMRIGKVVQLNPEIRWEDPNQPWRPGRSLDW